MRLKFIACLLRYPFAFLLVVFLPLTAAVLPLTHGGNVYRQKGLSHERNAFASPTFFVDDLQLTPTPFPTPTKVFLKGFYTYHDPSNLFFITLPETAKKLPGERPTIFQFQEDELLVIFQKQYLYAPQKSDLEELAEGLLFVLVERNNLGEQSRLLSSTLQKDYHYITATYLTPAQQWGKAFFAFKVSGSSVLGIMFVSPSPQADELWKTMISSFTLVRALSTPLPVTSDLEALTVLGGDSVVLPNEVRAMYRVPTGIHYWIEDYDYSLARLGAQKAVGSGRFPKDFVIRSQIAWWTAPGAVNWKEAGCGFIFRYMDKNNYYTINWSLDGKVFLKRKMKGYETLAFEAPYPNQRKASGEGKIMLAISDTQVVAFFNDKRVFRMIDSPLSGSMSSGEVGLVVFSGTNLDFGSRCRFTQNEIWEVNQP